MTTAPLLFLARQQRRLPRPRFLARQLANFQLLGDLEHRTIMLAKGDSVLVGAGKPQGRKIADAVGG
jgi:hypothetical protein